MEGLIQSSGNRNHDTRVPSNQQQQQPPLLLLLLLLLLIIIIIILHLLHLLIQRSVIFSSSLLLCLLHSSTPFILLIQFFSSSVSNMFRISEWMSLKCGRLSCVEEEEKEEEEKGEEKEEEEGGDGRIRKTVVRYTARSLANASFILCCSQHICKRTCNAIDRIFPANEQLSFMRACHCN